MTEMACTVGQFSLCFIISVMVAASSCSFSEQDHPGHFGLAWCKTRDFGNIELVRFSSVESYKQL